MIITILNRELCARLKHMTQNKSGSPECILTDNELECSFYENIGGTAETSVLMLFRMEVSFLSAIKKGEIVWIHQKSLRFKLHLQKPFKL